jgi:hypothetical protein
LLKCLDFEVLAVHLAAGLLLCPGLLGEVISVVFAVVVLRVTIRPETFVSIPQLV